VLADESEIFLTLTSSDLEGLPNDLIAAAKQAAVERNITTTVSYEKQNEEEKTTTNTNNTNDNNNETDIYLITLSRSLVVPFLTYSTRRDLREKAFKLWTSRGELNETRDNLKLATKIMELRLEQANIHGYASFADYATADTMAKTPENVMSLLEVFLLLLLIENNSFLWFLLLFIIFFF
jgi:peptidyl-dipeptidase Dcp